jgi:7-cyano-7-deazaguanine reductase
MNDLRHLGHQSIHVYEGADATLLDSVAVPPDAGESPVSLSVTIVGDEFTALCPATGGPDFGEITITYEPDKLLVESKSLKLYLESYRQHKTFHEAAIRKICRDLADLLQPNYIIVTGNFKPRGGWAIKPQAEWYKAKGVNIVND